MFYNTHAYVASKLHKSEDSLLLIGSMLPDIAITKIIPWDKALHGKENAKNFIKFLQEKSPNYLFLGRGVYAHCILDDFTHKDYQGGAGYAYQNSEYLSRLTGQYYNEDKEKAKDRAHSYIESGVEILVLNEHPEIQSLLKQAIGKIDLNQLAVLLSSYFQLDEENFKSAVFQYFDLVSKYDLGNKDNWIFFWEELNKLLRLKNIEDTKIKTLLDKSIDLTKGTYRDFLNYSIAKGLMFV